jgi:hypothetical protein
LLVIAAVGLAVLAPLRNPPDEHEDRTRDGRLADLELRKETKYGEIRDAEADFHAGKLSQDDYRELDRALRREAIAILEQIDRVNRTPPGAAPEENAEENPRGAGRPS